MPNNTRITTLRQTIIDQLGNFLYQEGFTLCEITPSGIAELVSLLSDYEEEGEKLYPEIIITNDFNFFKTIPNIEIPIADKALTIAEFKNIVKLCAPLCSSSWVIFIEIRDNRIKYGITCAEVTETTPTIYRQTVGDMKIDFESCTIAYIRNIGNKTIELAGLRNKILVSLTLGEPQRPNEVEIENLTKAITAKCSTDKKQIIHNYFIKILSEAFKDGHGNLIGVIDESNIDKAKSQIPDGTYLSTPIDIAEAVITSEEQKDNQSSVQLKQYSSVVKKMMNHDGITFFTNTGKLVAYHVIIQDVLTVDEKASIVGGARIRAYHSMCKMDAFNFCFIKSQDGAIKTK